jgi:hypothetical protein
VSKRCQEHQSVSKDIELYRNPRALENARFTGEFIYYLDFMFFRRYLHTGEVRGSSPLSPTIFFNELHNPTAKQNHSCAHICAQIRAGKLVYDRLEVLIRQVSIDFCGFAGLVAVHPRHSLSANMDTSVNIC